MAITDGIIRQQTTNQSYDRGVGYYRSNSVRKVVCRDYTLQSQVSGRGKKYLVQVDLDDQDDVRTAWCTCPYHESNDGWCKHIVATLLVFIYEPHTVQNRPTLEDMLDPLSKAEALGLLRDMVARKPEIIELIDRIVTGEGDSESEEGDY
jgi:uncharacterized Zn finger protein